jgi:hypothetical protein
MALKKIQDGIRIKISLQKSIDRKILLQKSLFLAVLQASGSFEKIEMQEFSDFENLQFVKNTKFSKFTQNLNFYYRDLRPKKKLLQFTQRITRITENPWFRPLAGWQILTHMRKAKWALLKSLHMSSVRLCAISRPV